MAGQVAHNQYAQPSGESLGTYSELRHIPPPALKETGLTGEDLCESISDEEAQSLTPKAALSLQTLIREHGISAVIDFLQNGALIHLAKWIGRLSNIEGPFADKLKEDLRQDAKLADDVKRFVEVKPAAQVTNIQVKGDYIHTVVHGDITDSVIGKNIKYHKQQQK